MGIQRNLEFLRSLARRIAPPTQMKVLIVDPDLVGIRALSSALPRNFAVSFAASAAEARAVIAKYSLDLVVVELHLPDVASIDLLSELRHGPATSHLLLLVVASHASVGEKVALLLAGADDCLIKPVEPEMFAHHVHLLMLSRATLRSDVS